MSRPRPPWSPAARTSPRRPPLRLPTRPRLPRSLRLPLRPRSLAGQLFAMQAVLIAVVVAGCAVFSYLSDRDQARDAARQRALGVAGSVADSPAVRAAIRTPDPTALLQPYATRVVRDTGVDFVTIMDPRGIRWTHPDESRIGGRFLGHTARALRGEAFTETYTGTLGPSVRAVVPVEDGGRIVGLVSAGIKVEAISARVGDQLKALIAVAAGVLALGGAGTYVINARLRRHTRGMNADELGTMHAYHQAALHAVREGLLLLDGQHRVALINDGGRELLGIGARGDGGFGSGGFGSDGSGDVGDNSDGSGSGDGGDNSDHSDDGDKSGRGDNGADRDALGRPLHTDVLGRPVAELGLPAPLTRALLSDEPRVDEVHLTDDRVLVVNTSPVSGGERRGTVVTLRDHTELQALTGELDSERRFTQALRAQAHEAANRLHTVVLLIELGRAEEAVEFATAELELAQDLTDRMTSAVAEPVLAALLLGKTAEANERGVELMVSEDSGLDDGMIPASLPPRDLITILGNLIDNALDATQGRTPARVTVTVAVRGERPAGELVLGVRDTGPGIDPAHTDDVFRAGFTTKPAGPGGRGIGLALVRQTVARHGGTLVAGAAPEGGARFEVRLPLALDDGAGTATGPGSPGDPESPECSGSLRE